MFTQYKVHVIWLLIEEKVTRAVSQGHLERRLLTLDFKKIKMILLIEGVSPWESVSRSSDNFEETLQMYLMFDEWNMSGMLMIYFSVYGISGISC